MREFNENDLQVYCNVMDESKCEITLKETIDSWLTDISDIEGIELCTLKNQQEFTGDVLDDLSLLIGIEQVTLKRLLYNKMCNEISPDNLPESLRKFYGARWMQPFKEACQLVSLNQKPGLLYYKPGVMYIKDCIDYSFETSQRFGLFCESKLLAVNSSIEVYIRKIPEYKDDYEIPIFLPAELSEDEFSRALHICNMAEVRNYKGEGLYSHFGLKRFSRKLFVDE